LILREEQWVLVEEELILHEDQPVHLEDLDALDEDRRFLAPDGYAPLQPPWPLQSFCPLHACLSDSLQPP
jgi:hypothetical protein